MNKRHILITEQDAKRLEELLSVAGTFNYRDRNGLKHLEAEIRRAKIVAPSDIPSNVVTMNTRLRFQDLNDGREMEVSLVFPSDSNIEAGNLSVLSPIGTAILGYAEGDTVEWPVPSGMRSIRIEKVLYQPEAAGDFHL